MSGRPGRGGPNKIPVGTHLLRGTFRPERHAADLRVGQPLWAPQPAQLEALGPDGRAFVERLDAVYSFTVVEGELVLEAAVTEDRLVEIRAIRVEASVRDKLALDKTEQWWQRQKSNLLAMLRVRP